MTSEDYIDVSSSAPGTYEITACSFPVTVQFSRTGYSPVTLPITNSPATLSLTCIGKNSFIVSPAKHGRPTPASSSLGGVKCQK